VSANSEQRDDRVLGASRLSEAEQLRSAEEELAKQNAELVSLSAALDAERRRYQQLFDRAPLAHLATDRRGRIVEANDAAGRMLQVEPRFLAGKPIAAFVDPVDRKRFRSWLLHVVEHEHPVFRFQRRPHITFEGEVHAFEDRDGLSWVIRDVTEERRVEQQIWDLNRDLEQRVTEQTAEIAAVYDQLPVGVAVVRVADESTLRLNRRALQMLGDEFPFDEQIAAALRGAEVHGAIVRFTPDGGNELAFEVSAVPLRGADGEVTGAGITFDDVTKRERVERADREFVSNASHQLRTPIAAIASAVAALKAGAGDEAVARQQFLDHLETESERLGRIVDALLVLSRAQRGGLDAPLTLVRVRPLVERRVAEVSAAAGVDLSWECEPGIAVIAHQALLEEAITNALANAVEHTRSGKVSITAEESGDEVVIEVADTGPGMEPEVRERAFERFFGSSPTRRSAGLGLAIAAAAIRASRGRIELHSEAGVGTRVRISLPSAPLLRS
jgi:PAS domain S-box-containing protein